MWEAKGKGIFIKREGMKLDHAFICDNNASLFMRNYGVTQHPKFRAKMRHYTRRTKAQNLSFTSI